MSGLRVVNIHATSDQSNFSAFIATCQNKHIRSSQDYPNIMPIKLSKAVAQLANCSSQTVKLLFWKQLWITSCLESKQKGKKANSACYSMRKMQGNINIVWFGHSFVSRRANAHTTDDLIPQSNCKETVALVGTRRLESRNGPTQSANIFADDSQVSIGIDCIYRAIRVLHRS